MASLEPADLENTDWPILLALSDRFLLRIDGVLLLFPECRRTGLIASFLRSFATAQSHPSVTSPLCSCNSLFGSDHDLNSNRLSVCNRRSETRSCLSAVGPKCDAFGSRHEKGSRGALSPSRTANAQHVREAAMALFGVCSAKVA
jgi:hypothetical protein